VSPLADGADLTSPAEAAAPAAGCLQDGEVIILAIRPSGWFVLLTAWPVLAAALCVALVGGLLAALVPGTVAREMVLLICLTVAVVRLLAGCFQWSNRLYVLTNRRALRIRGGLRADVADVRLKDVAETHVSVSRLERLFGIASLAFEPADPAAPGLSWIHIAAAADVRQIVDEAVRRAR
jgi:hypothetical protein